MSGTLLNARQSLLKCTTAQKLALHTRMKLVFSFFFGVERGYFFLDNLLNGLLANLGETRGHILSQNSCLKSFFQK